MVRSFVAYFVLGIFFVTGGCTVNYSFTGASIPVDLETVSVQYFDNRAMVVNPSLSQDITNSLMDMLQSRTRLKLTNEPGDADFEGVIEQYRTQPVSIQADEQANIERLTIAVRVSYTNTADAEQNFDALFSRHEDYDARIGLEPVEADLVKKIVAQLTEDIFNRAFVNW